MVISIQINEQKSFISQAIDEHILHNKKYSQEPTIIKYIKQNANGSITLT